MAVASSCTPILPTKIEPKIIWTTVKRLNKTYCPSCVILFFVPFVRFVVRLKHKLASQTTFFPLSDRARRNTLNQLLAVISTSTLERPQRHRKMRKQKKAQLTINNCLKNWNMICFNSFVYLFWQVEFLHCFVFRMFAVVFSSIL